MNWKNENFQEQEAYLLLLSEIYCALKIQKKGGNFVIKFFETFTELTVKMIEILRRYYKGVFITKPLLSRISSSERYIVCIEYKGYTDNIEKLFNIIKDANNHSDKYLIDIFPKYQISNNLDLLIKVSSTQISNKQHKQINEMITYINNGNYYGDIYRYYLKRRKEANDFWISLFLPISKDDLNMTRNIISGMMKDKLLKTNNALKDLESKYELVVYKFNDIK
jgi:hypothetical protein